MLGCSGGPLLAFHAPRGLGKTSLLRMAQRNALADGFLTVWAPGRDDRPMSPDMAQGLSAAVKDHSFGDRANALLDRLAQVQVEFGIPGVKVGATLSAEEKAPGSAVLEKLSRMPAGSAARMPPRCSSYSSTSSRRPSWAIARACRSGCSTSMPPRTLHRSR